MSVESLGNNSIILLRDQASLAYFQGGFDSDGGFARLIEGNLTALQPNLYFQVKATGVPGYWSLKTATGRFLRVNTEPGPVQDRIQWVTTDPASETVVDKSPYYFTFVPVPLSESPMLYALGTYYNGGMTLQQPGGPGTAIVMGPPQGVTGSSPELSFEIGVTSGVPVGLATLDPMLHMLRVVGDGYSSTGGCETGLPPVAQPVDPWAIALMVVFAVLALILLGYIIYIQFAKKPPSYRAGGATPLASTAITPTPPVLATSAVIQAIKVGGGVEAMDGDVYAVPSSVLPPPPGPTSSSTPPSASSLLRDMSAMTPVRRHRSRAVRAMASLLGGGGGAPSIQSGHGAFGLSV